LATVTIGTTLSTDLTFFTGKPTSTGNEFKWKAINETGFSHFEVEKSSNLKEFYSIAKIAGGVESGNYKAFDNTEVVGLNYYRLKMVDLDGTVEYSKTISVRNTVFEYALHVYPNPVQNLTFTFETIGTLKNVVISNSIGKIIKVNTISTDGQFKITMPSESASGIYLLQVETDKGKFTKRVMIE
jgi:Secretion system C-terminal sorting domain